MFCDTATTALAIPGMLLLEPEQHHIASACFAENYPNRAFIYSILTHKMPGMVFVDKLTRPHFAIILAKEPFGFVSKYVDFSILSDLGRILTTKANPHFKLVFDPSVLKHDLSILAPMIIQRRSYSLKRTDFMGLDMPTDPNLAIQMLDAVSFEACHLKERLYDMYQTKSNYLRHALGVGLLSSSGDILSEAHAIIANNICELGVFTQAKHRKQGYSKLVCQFLINACLAQNQQIQWTCNEDNLASKHLAESLGFKADYSYLSLAFHLA